MKSLIGNRAPLGWFAAAVLVAAGFVIGLAVTSGGGSGEPVAPLATAVATAQVASTSMSYADVAEMVMPAVVNISTDKVVEMDWHNFFDDPFFRRFFGPRQDRDRGEGNEQIQRSLGSGIVISADGLILTNNHVTEKASKIRVLFQDNVELEAEVIGTDPQTDVALIKVEADDPLPYVRFGDSNDLRIAEQVMAIGNPFGLGHTVTLGIVSALGRSIGLIDYEEMIQTDATINPGNSGGALVNMKGEVVGMSTAIVSRSGGSQGIGFAIPSNLAQRIMTSLKDEGEVTRAWLGVNIQPVTSSIAEVYGLDKPRGVMISNVNEDTPAEEAGLREGDIILSVDGEEVNTVSRLRNKISLSEIGHKAELEILREGKEKSVDVKLGKLDTERFASVRSREAEDDEGIDGVTVRNLDSRRRQLADVPDDIDGVLVVDVDRGSNASREGLAEGHVILEIGNDKVVDVDDYQRLLKEDEDKPILLRVYRPQPGDRIFMAIPR